MSLAVRLAAAFMGVVAAVAIVFGAVSLVAAGSGVNSQVDRFLQDRANELIDGTRGRPTAAAITTEITTVDNNRDDREDSPRNDGGKNKNNNAFDPDAIAQTVNADGQVLASTGLTLPVDDRDRAMAASGEGRNRYRTVELEGGEYRLITAAIPEGGVVQVARELTETNSTIGQIRSQLLLAILLVALLAGLGGILVARQITKPLRSLAASVDQVAATGDLTVPIEVKGDDEVGRVAAGFGRLLDSLARSQRQQKQLVQDAAHELRTPLTSVKANIDLLAAAPDLDQEIRLDSLRSAQAELRELAGLVDEIVEVATDRFTPRPTQPLDLSNPAEDALARFAVRVPGRTVETELASVIVQGDAESLSRAIGNLLANADKYSPGEQTITLTVDRLSGAGRVTVADRGPGIAPEERAQVFDRFYRSDAARSEPGSGLGLAIVASIVEEHGGAVGIDERSGGGAEVWFTVPSAT
ncbi:MAG: HAMP domain-containing sensor histidine kinase [Acidimicrobiales bacterium]